MENFCADISTLVSDYSKTLKQLSSIFRLIGSMEHKLKWLIAVFFLSSIFSFPSIAKTSLPAAANLIDSGNDRLKRKEYSEAIEFFRKALEKDLNNPILHFSLGIGYMGDKDLDLATEHFLRALELNPAMLEAYYSLALCYQMQGKKELALDTYRQGLGIDLESKLPKSIFWNEVVLSHDDNLDVDRRDEILAFNKQESEENNGSSLYFPKAELDENSNNTLNTINNIYSDLEPISLELHQEELRGYLNELKKNPNDSQLIYRIGLFYLKDKNYEKAYQVSKKLEKLDEYLASEIKNKLGKKYQTIELSTKTESKIETQSEILNLPKIYSKPPEIQSVSEKQFANTKKLALENKKGIKRIFKRKEKTVKTTKSKKTVFDSIKPSQNQETLIEHQPQNQKLKNDSF